jgi:methylaspartate mutase epsilon subunit
MIEIADERMSDEAFGALREEALASWPTGQGIRLEDGVACQRELPEWKVLAAQVERADREGRVLLQPRAGVALIDEHIELLRALQQEADLLPTTIDSYTRQNKYGEAEKGIARSREAGRSLLNGFPAVNHGVAGCRRVIESVERPVEVRHGTPDARLLAEITLAAGFSAFEGGAICYNIPYAKRVTPERSIRDWQYVDRLVGIYEERGARVNREPFGPLSGTLVPPLVSHSVAIIEGLLALRQGVRSVSLGYGQDGNLIQDVAAIRSLRTLADEYFQESGYEDYELTTVFHQWMGGFPENEARAAALIVWGAATAALAGATKVIVKTPLEASGVPSAEANVAGLDMTRQTVAMLGDQSLLDSAAVEREAALIKREVRSILNRVRELGEGDWARGAAKAIHTGVLDVPFAPSIYNAGKLLPVRDNDGAVRILEPGRVPLDEETLAFHRERVAERGRTEGRTPGFQMVIDDVYAISKGRLVGRPR